MRHPNEGTCGPPWMDFVNLFAAGNQHFPAKIGNRSLHKTECGRWPARFFFWVCVSTYFNCWLVNKQFDASVSCPDALSFSKRSFAVFRLALRVRHAFLNWPMYSMSDSSPSMGGNSSSFFSWSRGAAGLGWSLLPLRLTSLQVRTVCQTAPCPGAPVQTPSNVRHLLRHHP